MAVVGASLAGSSAVSALRSAGFDGRVVVVGEEQHAPYDRPPLSKEFLAGSSDLADIALPGPAEDSDDGDDGVEWRLGVPAGALDAPGAAVVLTSGRRVPCDGVVLATGARAKQMAAPVPAGVHTLRTLDDAVALREALRPGASLVVVGGGFIGAEVASTARGLGVEVTVVEALARPFADRFGAAVADVCAGLHHDHGTRLLTGATVTGFLGTDRVRGVRLDDGRELAADVVVVGIGSQPNVEWLAASGLATRDGVVVSERGATRLPTVVAAGDCAATYDPRTGRAVRGEHWTAAQHQARAAVATLLGQPYRPPASARAPYFWSDQYGARLQFAGHVAGGEDVEVVDGGVDARDVVVVHRRDADPVAVFAVNRAREFSAWRRALATPTTATTASAPPA